MNKRRRTSSVSRLDEDFDDNTSEPSPTIAARKRKKPEPDMTELCQQLYDSIRSIKKEDGNMLCDIFVRVPKRRQEPAYYEVVDKAIDLLKVQQKIKTDEYKDTSELTLDIELLVKNAKSFYKPDSTEYQDACLLWDTYNSNRNKLIDTNSDDEPLSKIKKVNRGRKSTTADNDDASETSSKADDDMEAAYEELFAVVMSATEEGTSRPLSTMFQLLPSKKQYPDYYDIIEHPIDLKFIATKIQTNAFISLSEMEKDLLQMTKNACTFNEPGSQIYKDAKNLRKIIQTKKIEIEQGKSKGIKIKRRGISLSAGIAALKEPIEESDDENDDNVETEGDGPLWQLFDQLYNSANATDHLNAAGAPLGESLWKLPNRHFHQDYYSQIKKPISMAQIRNKLKKAEYIKITDLTADLYLMLDNAKKAFPPAHKVHKDALKMQKILNQKLVDISVDEESDDDDDGSVSGIKKKGRPKIIPVTPSIATPSTSSISPAAISSISPKAKFPANPLLKKKLLNLQKFLTEYMVGNRHPMALFMEKPSKKQYPDYYDVIQHPIDMITIENNIKNDKYGTLDDVVGDFRLMFANCRKYNEDGSPIYEDANILERALNEKLKEFSGINDRRLTPKILKGGRKTLTAMDTKLRQLYDAIRDYREPKASRQLALIFMKLPSKHDYPDYYDIIKNPIDMEKIAHKLKQHFYDNVDEIASDFMLMFENACKYNEPDSQIYKDSLVLQQVCIQTKQSLRETDESVPDVPQAIQESLLSLFTTFYNHQDEEGRCFSDSLAELPEYDEIDSVKVRAISLDLIKRRLDKGLYKRLDIFQEDVFSCLDRARKLSRTDSQVFEDSMELQAFFIRKRDELCKDVLTSPALSYSAMHLSASVEAIRQAKLLQEEQEQEHENEVSTAQGESMTIDQKVYSPGDFVYYDVPESKLPGIIYIERLWTNNEGTKMMYGNAFLRPFETFHVTSRKFLEKELFKSEKHQAIPLSELGSKCFVMSAKDYFKYKPDGMADKDIFVCESRYSIKLRQFKKIKNWPFMANVPLKLRDEPLEPKRVQSVFKERVEKHKDELAELQLQEALIEKEKPNVRTLTNNDDGIIYYDQYNTICSGVVKTGDYVYVASEGGKQLIAQIQTIWEAKEDKCFFRGPWFLTPPEVPGTANRFFYRQELLLSTVIETSPIVGVVGRCAVLEYNDYISSRPTEISESDIYVCESTYDEAKKQIRRNTSGSGLKKFTHSQMVTPDEIYHFKPVPHHKVSVNEIAALEGFKIQTLSQDTEIKQENVDAIGIAEDSMDGGPASVGSETIVPIPTSVIATPVSSKPKKTKGKLVTGYILYSSEVRKDRAQNNPDFNFGDISRMVGNEWRSMQANEKLMWEEKARESNEESAKKFAEENGCPSPAPATSQSIFLAEPLPNQVFECLWDKCDWQFEDPLDCVDHCIAESTGHTQTHYTNKAPEAEYLCLWRNCLRSKKAIPAFPNLQRLVKHVREVHINKSGRIVLPADRSKNVMPSRRVPTVKVTSQQATVANAADTAAANSTAQTTPTPTVQSPTQNSQSSVQSIPQPIQIVQAPPAEPLFVTVPPRPQRVLHSEAYIKYIESLQQNSRFITPWEKTLKAKRETVPAPDSSKLPFQWLGPNLREKNEDAINCLWKLRDVMMKDVVTFKLNPSQY